MDNLIHAKLPSWFEASNPTISETRGLEMAINYYLGIEMQRIQEYKVELENYLYQSPLSKKNESIYGLALKKLVSKFHFVLLL